MRDDEHRTGPTVDDIARSQPEVAERMRPQLRLTQIGNGVAVLAVATSIGAIATFPTFSGGSTGSGRAVFALVSSVVLLAICTFQHLVWLRAMAVWRGEQDHPLARLKLISFVVHLVSYLVVLAGLWACIAGSVAAGTTSTAAALLAFTLLFLVLAQVLAGVQYLRVSGPPGTIPAHLRRLGAEIQRRR